MLVPVFFQYVERGRDTPIYYADDSKLIFGSALYSLNLGFN